MIRQRLYRLGYRVLVVCQFMLMLSACSDEQKVDIDKVISPTAFIEANGELASASTAMISPPQVKNTWQYKITFLVPEGSEIKKDQVIVKFDSSKLQQKLAVKQSELSTAQKNLENVKLTNTAELEKLKLQSAEQKMLKEKAQRKWQQSKGLESNLETRKLAVEYEIAENEAVRAVRVLDKTQQANQMKQAIEENKVQRLQAEVNQLKSDISKLSVKAPKSGILIYSPDYKGEKVSSGDTVWLGRRILELPTLEQMIVRAQVLEAEAGKIALDQTVDVVLDAAQDKTFQGKVSELGNVFRRKSREQANIIFDIKVKLDKTDPELMRPGMAARLKIKIKNTVQELSATSANELVSDRRQFPKGQEQ